MGIDGARVLRNRIENAIEVHHQSQDVTVFEVMGVLEVIKLNIYERYLEEEDEEKE